MVNIFSYQLTLPELFVFYTAALLAGMSKTGVYGAGLVAVPLLAVAFGGKASTGLILPILSFADVMATWYYHRHASWKHLKSLFPWTAVGVIAGTITGDVIHDELFREIMAVTIFASVAIMIWLEKGKKEEVPEYPWFAAFMGIAGGFTSMVGNLAGPVMAIYLLSMRLPKNIYIGTSAWFFLMLNLFKIPFHIFAWDTITFRSFLLDLTTLPVVLLGAFAGIFICRRISERVYRWFVILTTIAASIMLIV